MSIPIVETSIYRSGITEITITIEGWSPPRIPNLTQEDFDGCPDRFCCFVCLRTKGKNKHLTEIIRFQRICRVCFPHIDDRTIRGLISFDLRGGFQVRGYPRRAKLKWTKPSDRLPALTRANTARLEIVGK